MKISEIDIRLCRHHSGMTGGELRDGQGSELEFLVITFKTDEGLSASSFGYAGRGARPAGEIAATSLKPFFLGRDPLYREKNWQDFRVSDRWWHLTPIYSFGPFDVACWLLSAQAAGQPLYKYLGAYRDEVPVYASSLVLPQPADYAEQALAVKAAGWAGYKLHPPGDYAFDLEAHRLVREAVGPDFTLMSDPVAAYTTEQALRMGRELERLDYHWFEEPLADENFHGLRELTRALDIPIAGAEVLAKRPYSMAECMASRVVDIVRADVSWGGGVTAVMKTAHLADAFGVQCEIHTAIYHPLELVNLHCAAAIKNSEFFELLWPTDYFNFGLAQPLVIENGKAQLPQGPGLGAELDWDLIEDATFDVL
jgi:L-alanine-DL-glutamate epimerase-like enolase superfamily enzyme